ncbi:GAF domain-containing protein [Halomonas sp. DP1Y21-3]|uniref:GAF domain-containing protein n=1 Tax=Halomonas sp. DP1Y21-3 TaxID=2859080 RepID=UPI001C9874B9|nr:GAF domain-containing protein [Halomonas sp. DP1Y21-3]MBY6109930.1 GAF domain-containing protein [Halomonas sp. DP1Y21-3]
MNPGLADILVDIIDPATPFDRALERCAEAIPNGLFTAMRFHRDSMEVERIHSTLPDVYPVSGRKPKRDTEWGDKVLLNRRVNLGYGEEDIVWAFGDHRTILGLGLKAVLNVPIVRGENVLGTLNFLRDGPGFTEQEAATGQLLAAAIAMREWAVSQAFATIHR